MTTPASAVIQVWFIDEQTGNSFAQTKLPIAQLPESFQAETPLQLGESSYLVVSATPPTAREFGRAGELRLVLRRQAVTMMNPRDILFSLPSICSELPSREESRSPRAQLLELHEDDWRQVEFVSVSLQTLALNGNTLGRIREPEARLLAAFAAPRQLLLVDWCRAEMLPAAAPRLQAWLLART